MSFYLGLSILSNADSRNLVRAEARRILSALDGRPANGASIARGVQGRPFFPGRDVDFSIAHSGALASVAYVSGKNIRAGCDVERVRPRPRAKEIAEAFFTVSERDYIESGGNFDVEKFYRIWTLKECFLKLRGLSVFDMAVAPSFTCGETLKEGAVAGAEVSPLTFSLYELTGNADEHYILAAAIEGTEAYQPEIRWYSQGFLDCKSIVKIKAAPNPAETVSPKI
jgi:4'-phosphopantetheinyl transferase